MTDLEEGLKKIPEGIQATPAVIKMFESFGPKYIWFAVITSMLGSFSTLLTGTIINVAIPEVMGAFGIGQDKAQWLSTAFLAAGTVTMLLTSWCIQALGMRVTYISAMLIFLGGSILGGLAPNHEILIFSRIITGAAAGIMGPIAMVLTFQIFPVKSRGFAMGIFGIGVVLAPALGPALGGYLIDHFSWRYVFFLAIPFSVVSIPLAIVFMPQRDGDESPQALDWIGFLLSSIFLVFSLTALSDGLREGWGSNYIISLFGISGISFIAFIWWESIVENPLLDLRIFTYGRFVASALVTFTVGIGIYGSTYLVPLFLQNMQGVMPTDSGLLMLPAGLAMAACFPLAGALSDRIQPGIVIFVGLLLFAFSSWLMRNIDVNTAYQSILIWALIGRVGLAFIFPSLNAASMASLPLSMLSQGSGAVNFLRQLGGAFGVNILSIHLTQSTIEHSHHLSVAASPIAMDTLIKIQDMMFNNHLGYILQFPASYGFLSNSIYNQALTMAFREGFILIAIVFFIALVPTLFMRVKRT
ncbi:MAG: DHA2 family efflux MFS transporter permease subunit [Pseudomonadales bacterium]|nr:DHA2 family efflux MFS transporter permease subunit [Pseudomonadales bacterium]